jgi:predicted  nucleic acid-binding Zn-ribbon protein
MRKNLDIDRQKVKQENYIKEEIVRSIQANTPIRLIHDIFYKDDFKVYKDINDKQGSMIQVATDYTFEDCDEIATYDSQRLCYRTIYFKDAHDLLYIDYWVYGDTLSADMMNELEEKLSTAEIDIDNAESDISELNARMSSAESQAIQTDENISGLNTRLTAAESSLTTAQGDIVGLDNQRELLDERLGVAEIDIDNSESDINELNARMSSAESQAIQTDENINGLNTRLTAAELLLLDAHKDISELDKEIKEQEANSEDLSSRMVEVEETLNGKNDSPGLVKEVEDFINSKNQNNGIAGLNEKGKIPNSFIEAIIEVDNFQSLPTIGKDITIYITKDDNMVYRWDGKSYIALSSSGGSGVSISASSFYAFYVSDDGNLYIVYPEGEEAPDFEVDDDGNLWATFEIEDEE